MTAQKGPGYSCEYSTLGKIIDIITDVMFDNGLAFSQVINPDIIVTTYVMHTSGQYIRGTIRMPGRSDDPKTVGALISYAKKYALSALLNITSEEDDE